MPDVEQLIKTYETLKSDRGNWEIQWEQIAELILPRQMGFVGKRTRGEKRTYKIFDSSPCIALERFAAVMDSLLTPRQTRWHYLSSDNEYINRDFQVRSYFDELVRIIFHNRYQPKANFAGQNSERWIGLGAFGNGVIFTDWFGGFRYRNTSLQDVFFLANHQGQIDTVFRRVYLTPRQVIQKFPDEEIPKKIRDAADNPSRAMEEFEFFHCVMPNLEYDAQYLDSRGFLYASIYVCMESRTQMGKASGYRSFPFSISRYITAPNEVYGRGPGSISLPDIRMLNEMAKTDIRAVHKLVDPPLLLHDDGILGNGAMSVNITPGGLNFGGVNQDGRQLIQPMVTGARVDINEAKMEQRRKAIDSAFLVTLFQILVETPRMTATEALLRAQEKGVLLTPAMGRQQSEALGPLIEREIELLATNGKLPPMPPILREAAGEYKITYESPLTRMQRAEELVGVQQSLELLTPYAQLDPSVLDVIDQDELAQLTVEVSGVPTRVVRSPQKIAERRQARADAEQAERQAQIAQPVAGAMKDVAQAQALAREG